MSEGFSAYVSGREEETLVVTTEQPLNTGYGVLLETENGFILKLQEMISNLSKWRFPEDPPKRYQTPFILLHFVEQAEVETFYQYRAETVGQLQQGKLESTDKEAGQGETVEIYEGDEFNLLYEADGFSLEEKLRILEGENNSGFEEHRPTSICQHRFQRTGKEDKYSLTAVDIGLATKNWNHIPRSLTIRKNHETGNFEIYNHLKGDYSEDGTLWTGSIEEIVEKANTLSGGKSFEVNCGETSCPEKNPDLRYMQEVKEDG